MKKTRREAYAVLLKPQRTPFYCWRFNEADQTLEQYIPNDVFRRQDLPPAWIPNHYVCCFKGGEISKLNEELINSGTIPFFLDDWTAANVTDVDTPEDLERWKRDAAKGEP